MIFTVPSVLAIALTTLSLWYRQRIWFRRVTILTIAPAAVGYVAFGLMNVARFEMIDDHALLRSQIMYSDAYRAGLLAAQRVAADNVPTALALYACLAVLAWAPVERTNR